MINVVSILSVWNVLFNILQYIFRTSLQASDDLKNVDRDIGTYARSPFVQFQQHMVSVSSIVCQNLSPV